MKDYLIWFRDRENSSGLCTEEPQKTSEDCKHFSTVTQRVHAAASHTGSSREDEIMKHVRYLTQQEILALKQKQVQADYEQ